MRILISGGSGFIGSKLALALLGRGHSVTVLDNLSPQVHGAPPEASPLYQAVADSTRFIRGDVRNRDDWIEALDGADAVLHYAAETGTGQSMYEVSRYSDVNIGGTALLFDVLGNRPHSVKKIVVASSRAVYGEGKYRCGIHGVVYPGSRRDEDMRRGDFEAKCPICGATAESAPTTEDTPKRPSSLYGLTKQVQEEMTLFMSEALGVPVYALRYQNVYGPGQSLANPYTGILSIFSTRLLAGKDIDIFEDGKESRDFVFVDDAVDATIRVLEADAPASPVYNVGTGVPTDILGVARALAKAYGSSSAIRVSGDYRVGDIRRNTADISRLRHDLGFEPKVPFAEGILRFAAWAKESTRPADRYEESLEEMRAKGLFRRAETQRGPLSVPVGASRTRPQPQSNAADRAS
jgi:dTDP-L-rhamnose 4-epimerase